MFTKDIISNYSKLTIGIEGKNVLVVGGAGTIGSSFIKALLMFKPVKMVIVDINENALTELVRDLRSTKDQYIPEIFLTYPVSFDSPIFKKIFLAHGPFDIVANFAAHKHVRSEKDIFSIEAMLENNLLKAKGLLELLKDAPPAHFFCVSTDKAANPVNIMGASKKMMEDLLFSYATYFKVATARFANVAFSNGSLLDGFIRRIEKQQPLACPSDVTRFFVSPQESGEICLLACILSNNSEIFFPKLDMKMDLINFMDICTRLLTEFGFSPYIATSEEDARNSMHLLEENTYPVFLFKTNTSGEKLYEEFYTDDETIKLDQFDSLGVISKKSEYSIHQMGARLAELEDFLKLDNLSKDQVVKWLKKSVSNFEHIETGVGLDTKM